MTDSTGGCDSGGVSVRWLKIYPVLTINCGNELLVTGIKLTLGNLAGSTAGRAGKDVLGTFDTISRRAAPYDRVGATALSSQRLQDRPSIPANSWDRFSINAFSRYWPVHRCPSDCAAAINYNVRTLITTG